MKCVEIYRIDFMLRAVEDVKEIFKVIVVVLESSMLLGSFRCYFVRIFYIRPYSYPILGNISSKMLLLKHVQMTVSEVF